MFSIFNFGKHKKAEPIFQALEVDMHNHTIPNVDDGSESLEMSADCIETMCSVGFSSMFVTPHFNFPKYQNDEDDIRQRYDVLCAHLQQQGVPMNMVGIAGEYRIDDGIVDRMANPRFLTLGEDQLLLVEISLRHHRMGFEQEIGRLQEMGYTIILAHPERYLYLDTHSRHFEQLKDQGVIFQSNVLSLSGFYGGETQRRALELIEQGWVELLGTDMHNYAYADALKDASHSRTVQRVLEHHVFMNRELIDKKHHKL